jgi:hypothetical protein
VPNGPGLVANTSRPDITFVSVTSGGGGDESEEANVRVTQLAACSSSVFIDFGRTPIFLLLLLTIIGCTLFRKATVNEQVIAATSKSSRPRFMRNDNRACARAQDCWAESCVSLWESFGGIEEQDFSLICHTSPFLSLGFE